jgi:2-[(L-alanin-3-ylcarbamoyl)methyl]-2-hydroxybutanedioate decarboxylase
MNASPSVMLTPMLSQNILPKPVLEQLNSLANCGDVPISTYLYCPEVAARQATRLRASLPDWAELFYAVKANSFPPVLEALAQELDGFEVASSREAELATSAAGAAGKPTRLIASGPGKSEANLARLIQLGTELINVESVLELHRVARHAEEVGRRLQVALRVNPSPVTITDALRLGGVSTPFGIAEEDVPDALAAAAALPAIKAVGFHFHVVCNNLDASAHAAYVRWCLAWSARMAGACGVDLQIVDVGGGLGIPAEGQASFDLQRLGDGLRAIQPPADTRVLFEPGRWLVNDCGYYAAEITDLKRVHGSWFVVLRGGINHFLRPVSDNAPHNFTVVPVERWPYPYPRPEVRDAPVTVVGELCTPADVLARDVAVERIRAGDVAVFPWVGSYGWELALQEFLGHPRAGRVKVHLAADAAV